MRFGLFGGATAAPGAGGVSDSQIYGDFIDYVCEAEELGFHSVFLVEHHFTGLSQVSASLNLLTYLAAKTKRMRLGTAVIVLPWHNPALLAEQAATLDLLSGGRFDFGIGRGYRHNEFAGFCIPPEEAEERYQETLDFLRTAWTSNGRFSHHGKRWHFDDIVIEPPTTQKPHPPFWVGAGSPVNIRKAGEQGFNLLLDAYAPPPVLSERVGWYREAVEAHGGRFDPYQVGVTRALHLAYNQAEREHAYAQRAKFLLGIQSLAADPKRASSIALPSSLSETARSTEESALIGKPDEIVRRVQALKDAGIEYLLLLDVGGSRQALRTFAREVMPAFPERPTQVAAE
jgi:alkanesulfonate monooxygenase SsuD/methylene tetrahydromethanopterin reductase-like flavin-dependent oxidoreductase (luciferase family)